MESLRHRKIMMQMVLPFKACLSDLEYSDNTDSSNRKIMEKMVDGVSKKFIKGERLRFYPTGMPYLLFSQWLGCYCVMDRLQLVGTDS